MLQLCTKYWSRILKAIYKGADKAGISCTQSKNTHRAAVTAIKYSPHSKNTLWECCCEVLFVVCVPLVSCMITSMQHTRLAANSHTHHAGLDVNMSHPVRSVHLPIIFVVALLTNLTMVLGVSLSCISYYIYMWYDISRGSIKSRLKVKS